MTFLFVLLFSWGGVQAAGPKPPKGMELCSGVLRFSATYDLQNPRGQLFDQILARGLTSTALAIEFLAGHPLLRSLRVAELFDGSSGVSEGYTLREHTQMVLAVLREQAKFYSIREDYWRLFLFTIVVHDVGKPLGIADFTQREGRPPRTKDEFKAASRKQVQFTLPIVNQIMDVFSFTSEEKEFVVALLEDDALGGVVTGRLRANEAHMGFVKKAARTGLSVKEFFAFKKLMYMVDAGSYPGLRYGIGLASQPRSPVFVEDENGQLLPVSPFYYQLTAMIDEEGMMPWEADHYWPRRQRIHGAFMGQAFGDAVGAVTEMYSQQEIAQVFGDIAHFKGLLPIQKIEEVRGRQQLQFVRIPGTVTDDTQQAMALLWVLTQYPEWGDRALELWAQVLVRGDKEAIWRGTGSNFRAAVEKLKKGVSYKESGTPTSSLGAAMRVAAIAGFQRSTDKNLTEAVLTSGLVTHAHLHSAALSYAVFWVIREFVDGVDVGSIRAALPEKVKTIEEQLLAMDASWKFDRQDPHTISQLFAKVLQGPLDIETITARVLKEGAPYKMADRELHANNPSSELGGIHAVVLALSDTKDPVSIIHYIANMGDDTDTVAAIAGGILGARFGLDQIPAYRLGDQRRLEKYSNSLMTGEPPESLEDYFRHEGVITQRERGYQNGMSGGK